MTLKAALARANEKLAQTQSDLRASAEEVTVLKAKLAARTEMSEGLFQICERAIRRCVETQEAMHKWRVESQLSKPLEQNHSTVEMSNLIHSAKAKMQSLEGYMELVLEESREISEASRTLIDQLYRTDFVQPGSGTQRVLPRFTLVDAMILLNQKLQSAIDKESGLDSPALGRLDEGVSAKLEALTQRIVKLSVLLEEDARRPEASTSPTVAIDAISSRLEHTEKLLITRLEAMATPVSNHLALIRKLAAKLGAG